MSATTSGSSPPTRGAPVLHVHDGYPVRLIPAYAGSTRIYVNRISSGRAHPRLRGEHHHHTGGAHIYGGSSPPTRGALRLRVQTRLIFGLIPAYAGSTWSIPFKWWGIRAHPRLRGEHHLPKTGWLLAWGSSPPTRGAPLATSAAISLSGLIPAYAGSTPLWSRTASV